MPDTRASKLVVDLAVTLSAFASLVVFVVVASTGGSTRAILIWGFAALYTEASVIEQRMRREPATSPTTPSLVAGRWWRVLASDGSVWCETSVESEARAAVRPRRGDRLQRLHQTSVQYEWSDV